LYDIPENLIRTTLDTAGEEGKEWLARLPRIISAYSERWRITVDPPFPELSYNYAAPAHRSDGTEAVLKLSLPWNGELRQEAAALQAFDGNGMARLLELDLQGGALLLERLQPGTPLFTLADDDEVTTIAAGIMQEIWRPVPQNHPFPSVADWGTGFSRHRAMFEGTSGPLPAGLFDEGDRRFAELTSSSVEPVLLHGDLHHGNILAAERQPWLAIDPKGPVGEPAYETGAWLRNWLGTVLTQPNPRGILNRRIDLFSEILGFERERIRAWGFAQAILSAIWTVEDHGYGWESAIQYAELLH
jgi:streptomycin 6-kinase